MKRFLLFFIVLIMSFSVFSQNHYSVKYSIEKEHIVIPANIETLSLSSFVFDTGCAMTNLTLSDLAYLKRMNIISDKNKIGDIYAVGMSGTKRLAHKYKVPCICIGNLKIHDVEIIFSDTNKRTLGYNILKRFDNVSINFQNKTVIFEY